MRIILPYTPPYNWAAMMNFLQARATPGVERVDAAGYRRTIVVRGYYGTIAVAPMADAHALTVDVDIPEPALIPEIIERVARMFDVDTDPSQAAAALSRDPLLKRACTQHAGIRLPGAWDPFELSVRAILGQQITVRAATTLAGRVAARWGTPLSDDGGEERLFPTAAQLAEAPLEKAGVIAARAKAIRALAQAVGNGSLVLNGESVGEALTSIKGIGEWTARYIAMRAFGDRDALPTGDIVLRKRAGNCTAKQLEERSRRWQPHRSYAVMLLWQTAADESRDRRRPRRGQKHARQAARRPVSQRVVRRR